MTHINPLKAAPVEPPSQASLLHRQEPAWKLGRAGSIRHDWWAIRQPSYGIAIRPVRKWESDASDRYGDSAS